jgi:hypothetical protein
MGHVALAWHRHEAFDCPRGRKDTPPFYLLPTVTEGDKRFVFLWLDGKRYRLAKTHGADEKWTLIPDTANEEMPT